jgi:hypothetical protein
MRPPEPIRDHPNATFVLGTAPLSALIGWLISLHWNSVPTEVSTASGTVLSSACLVFAHTIKRAGGAVWEYGIAGCCHRLWLGRERPKT